MGEFKPFISSEIVRGDVFIEPLAIGIVKDPSQVAILESTFNSEFTKPSAYHGRSMEDPVGLVLESNPVTDEYGQVYTSTSIKGADASLPAVSFSNIEPSSVRVNGMMDASTFERCQAMSKILRSAGVLTEWPLFHARPKRFPDGESERGIGLLAFKKLVYENYIVVQEAAQRRELLGYDTADSAVTAGRVGASLLEMQFGVMYRAMLSNARIAELDSLDNSGKFHRRIADAIKSLQVRRPTQFDSWDLIDGLDPESITDQETYLRNVLPRLMGENLAFLHNTGSYHKYLHAGNWTLAAEIVDLDSVRNAEVYADDEPEITVAARMEEIWYAGEALRFVSDHYRVDPGELISLFRHAYFDRRYGYPSVSELESILLECHLHPMHNNAETLGKARIAKVTNAQMMSALAAAMRESKRYSDHARDQTFDDALRSRMILLVEKQVYDYLENNGINLEAKWLRKDLLVRLEIAKLQDEFADQHEDTGPIALISV